MRIQHNIMAMNAYRNYNNNTSALSKNLEKLSSGYKINRAGDDAAGLAISEKMRAQITGLNAAQKNVKDGISLVKTAEGAMQEIQDMLSRMKYLATQSANGTYDQDVDRFNLQKEVDSLRAEINRIADSANFNGINLLDGKMGFGASGSTTTPGANSAIDDTVQAAIDSIQQGISAGFTDGDGSGQNMTQDIDLSGLSFTNAGSVEVTMGGKTYTVNVTAGMDGAAFADALETAYNADKIDDEDGGQFTVANDGAGKLTFTASGDTAASSGNPFADFDIADAAPAAATASATAAASGTVTGYEIAIAGDDGTNALSANDSITIDGKTYNLASGGTIDSDTATTFADQMAAAVALYNAETDTSFTAAYADGKLTLTLKDGETAPTTAPTVTISDAASNISAGTAIEVTDTTNGNQQGNITGKGEITLQIGDTADGFNQLTVKIGDMHVSALGKRPGTADLDANGDKTGTYTYAAVATGQSIADIDISTLNGAQTAIDVIKDAINYVSSVRGDLGAVQNRLDHTANNLSVMTENITDAESTIRDTDVAEEMMAYTKNNILIQSAQAMLAQANAVPQGVLQLLG